MDRYTCPATPQPYRSVGSPQGNKGAHHQATSTNHSRVPSRNRPSKPCAGAISTGRYRCMCRPSGNNTRTASRRPKHCVTWGSACENYGNMIGRLGPFPDRFLSNGTAVLFVNAASPMSQAASSLRNGPHGRGPGGTTRNPARAFRPPEQGPGGDFSRSDRGGTEAIQTNRNSAKVRYARIRRKKEVASAIVCSVCSFVKTMVCR